MLIHLLLTVAEARMVKYCGRRILCNPTFRLYMVSPLAKPAFSPHIASVTTLINYGCSNENIIDDLLLRAFARLRPDLYKVSLKYKVEGGLGSMKKQYNIYGNVCYRNNL